MSIVYVVLLALAFSLVEFLIGGTRLLFSLPSDGVFALAALLSVIEIRRAKARPNAACLVASAGFFGYVLGRGLTSPVAYLAWFDEYLVLGALLVYLLTACYLTHPRHRLWVLLGLLALAAVNLAIAARQFSRGDDYMLNGFVRSDAYRGRGSGFYICPDHLAGFLEVIGSLALAQAIWSRQALWRKLLLGYAGAGCFAGLLLTASRGGALAAATALLTLAGLGLLRGWATSARAFWRNLAVLLVLAMLAGAGLTAVLRGSALLQGRASAMLDQQNVRLLLWPAAVEEFKTSPWFGTGAATYRFYGRLFRDPRVQRDPVRTHNDYLELLAEYGAVGAAGLLCFLGAHLRWGWRAFRRFSPRAEDFAEPGRSGSNAAAWSIGALAAVASFLVHSVFDFNLHIPANACLLAFVFGVLANPGRSLQAGGDARIEPFRWPDLLPRLALPALALWVICAGLPKLPGEYYCERARVALRDKHYLSALHEAHLGLEHEQQNPDLYFYLGEANQDIAGPAGLTPLSRSFREAAIEPYRAGERLYPQNSQLLLRLGEALTRLGDLPGAGEVFAQALRWDPNSSLVYTYYGFFLQSAGRVAEARIAYQRALALGYVAEASANLDRLPKPGQVSDAPE